MQSTAMVLDSDAYCVANERRFKKESTTTRPGSFEVRSERIPGSAEVNLGTTGGGEPATTCTSTVPSARLVRWSERSKLATGRFHQWALGDMMRFSFRFLGFVILAIAICISAGSVSANSYTLKCNSSKDRVWVYDSLASFAVEAKLNCGEAVEVLERVQDYVKIRAQNGVEGYVPESAFSELPAVAHNAQPAPSVAVVAKQVEAKEIAKTAATGSTFLAKDAEPRATETPKQNASAGFLPDASLAEMHRAPVAPSKPAADAGAAPAQPKPLATVVDASGPALVTVPVAGRAAVTSSGTDENPEARIATASEDASCQRYFSAYGLTSAQLKWIARNRQKSFPSVCPAPDPASVNFVFIFTHDVNFFGSTLPEPVHKLNGFSDFQPLAMVDNALVSESDKAHREYVWIFEFAKGGFNPESFTPHSRYEFSKVETSTLGSNAGPKAVEDAFRFAENANR